MSEEAPTPASEPLPPAVRRPAPPILISGLATPLEQVAGIGKQRADRFLELGLRNVGQLVAHLPMRHELELAESPIAALIAPLTPASATSERESAAKPPPPAVVAARGEITAVKFSAGPKPRLNVAIQDDTARLDLVFFNMGYLRTKLHAGMRIVVHGKLTRSRYGMQMVNPRWAAEHETQPRESDRLRPVYPACEAVTSREIERAIQTVLPAALPLIDDHFQLTFRASHELPPLADAYRMFHAPAEESEIASARRRLAYDELFLLQLAIAMQRSERSAIFRALSLPHPPAIAAHIRARFPFTLTLDQQNVIDEVAADLAKVTPANRLIQGDVGSGKTAVAIYAMLLAVAAGHQAAIMAPTELLAEQHYRSMARLLAQSKVRLALLTGSMSAPARTAILAGLADGSIDMVIGTHALLTGTVKFSSLALIVIDEQHRFGVSQRAKLREKGAAEGANPPGRGTQMTLQALTELATSPASANIDKRPLTPHTLVMTATPIPRTLALTLFGDLDVSTIKHLPPGRKPITTRIVGHSLRTEVYEFLRERIDKGEQGYIVAPMIREQERDESFHEALVSMASGDGSEVPAPKVWSSVESTLAELTQPASPLAGRRIAALHGQMDGDARERIMNDFRAGLIDVLVATTVIEVGVDVPNASVMIVLDADRFGLAQLHQLRGRIGRGSNKSACVLVADPVTPAGIDRLEVMRTTTDGFKLAERDFDLRGFGDVVGVRQSGLQPFKVADVSRDMDLLLLARRDALALIERSPNLSHPDEKILRRRLLKAHGQWLGLADVG